MHEAAAEGLTIRVRDATDALVGLQKLRESALLAGLGEVERSTVLTVFSELASNIHKHAGRGSVRVDRVADAHGTGIRIEATDDGQGIPDVRRAMEDSFSTAGTLGLGLPGVRRMASDFAIESEPGHGTRVRATVRCAPGRPAVPRGAHDGPARVKGWEVGRCVRPLAGQRDCGDVAVVRARAEAALLVLIDGTGHGPNAQRAASAAAAVAEGDAWTGLEDLLRQVHARLVGTAGASVGALLLDRPAGRFAYAAVGNTTAAREVGDPWRGISRDGMLGERLPSIFVQHGDAAPGDVFVMASDGVGSAARSAMAPRAARLDPASLAREIVAERGRPYDDASCVVARWTA
jgi:anti-sigma regulatory factor (Ser/Thr protein kinase)